MLLDMDSDTRMRSDSLEEALANKLSLLASLCALLVLALSNRLSLLALFC